MARNTLGNSDELSVNFDVLYPPRNIRTEPGRLAEVKVPGRLRLECGAEGYPPPTYQWLQKVVTEAGEEQVYSRGEGRTLSVDNATYEHEGQWACLAMNVIKGEIFGTAVSESSRRKGVELKTILSLGQEKFVRSDTFLVEVSGKPQIVSSSMDSSVWFPRATEAMLKVTYCSDPQPLRTEWTWNNLVLRQGKTITTKRILYIHF